MLSRTTDDGLWKAETTLFLRCYKYFLALTTHSIAYHERKFDRSRRLLLLIISKARGVWRMSRSQDRRRDFGINIFVDDGTKYGIVSFTGVFNDKSGNGLHGPSVVVSPAWCCSSESYAELYLPRVRHRQLTAP